MTGIRNSWNKREFPVLWKIKHLSCLEKKGKERKGRVANVQGKFMFTDGFSNQWPITGQLVSVFKKGNRRLDFFFNEAAMILMLCCH